MVTNELLTEEQVGEWLQVKAHTIRYLRRSRQMAWVRVARRVRIPRDAVVDYLKKGHIEALDKVGSG